MFEQSTKPKNHNLVIQAETLTDFQDLMNQVIAEHQVFATQTHINVVCDKLIYTAVMFTRR